MNKKEWIAKARFYLVNVSVGWEDNDALDYCEALYENYVEDNPEDPFTPQEAVDEDMTYWD